MRNAALPLVFALVGIGLTACHTDFRSRYKLPEDCERKLFFEDNDGDGWGAPGGAAAELCQADEEAKLTARNNLDCNDEDGIVTGRTATLCPDELVVGGSDYIGIRGAGAEFAAVLPTSDFSHVGDGSVETTPLTFSEGAASACSANGWGGQLATFTDLAELTEVTDALDDAIGDNPDAYYAAWVGFEPSGGDWKWADREVGEGLPKDQVRNCDDDNQPDPTDTSDKGLRLALVKQPGADDWCFGFPSDANPAELGEGELAYEARAAHFLCEREPPLASDFPIDRQPPE